MEKEKSIVSFDRGDKIDYVDEEGMSRYYIVDWKIIYDDGSIKLVESKPFELLLIGIDNYEKSESIIFKLESVEKYCKKKGYYFEYWTDENKEGNIFDEFDLFDHLYNRKGMKEVILSLTNGPKGFNDIYKTFTGSTATLSKRLKDGIKFGIIDKYLDDGKKKYKIK